MENLDWLILQELYNAKNITKAAQKLYMSQPALTARLQNIESEFNVCIVIRSTKGVRFTPEGEYLVQKADDILQLMHTIQDKVQTLHNKVNGIINIGASNYFTLYTLPRLLEKFQKQYPAVRYTVTTDWSKIISQAIYHQKIHIGFVSSDYGYASKVKLYDEPICVVCREPFKLQDLPNMPRIDYQSDALIRAQLEQWWGEHFAKPSWVTMHVAGLDSCHHMLKHGLGYAFIPYQLVAGDKNMHTIILRDAEGNELRRTSWMLYNEETADSATIKAFIDFVKKYPFCVLKGEAR